MNYTSSLDKTILHTSEFLCEQPKSLVFVIHGMAEHRHRYNAFASILQANQYAVILSDLRGHGDSPVENTLGYFGARSGYHMQVEDFHMMITQLKQRFSCPIIVIGHSMGSLFARALLKAYPEDIDALILSGSPWLPAAHGLLRVFTRMLCLGGNKKPGKLVDKLLNQTLSKDIDHPATAVDWLSTDANNVQSYIADPLCGFPFTNRGYVDLMDLFGAVYKQTWQLRTAFIPVLFLAGKYDPCPDFKHHGFAKAVDNLRIQGYDDIHTILYEKSRHEILLDVEKDKVTHDIIEFLDKTSQALGQ